MLSKKRFIILSICLVSITILVFVFLKYSSTSKPHSNPLIKISLKDTVLDKFDTDIAFEAYEKIHEKINFTKEEFVFMAKAYYCIYKIPRNILEKYFIDCFNEYASKSYKGFSREEKKEFMIKSIDKMLYLLDEIFTYSHKEEFFANAVELLMCKFKILKPGDVPKVKILQKKIGILNSSFNSILEQDLKSELTEKKHKRGILMLSYIEIVLNMVFYD
ncbi:hypothetical protein NCER_101478 [Vairimorpha ceranae BRL01]|uniref:Uncharacterized protein n=2 Tax=Vairimorpha ceranae TaxID=40302 RepID=C4VA41_VAIC1|nr:hypothetical protein AAJ76_7700010362 [Vairimorpha ceranae]EEQ81908.1 hypothetical protein NCER_101478 [Vairimorpha ceranae BRL01]KAF5139654.1 hypothetical protein G9O61_00g021720 [Vairimorpha ceranae]KAF5139786.1 hypothetical protein G9O61_00g020690 [Vairimorpha ceranae]KKO74388.1 hypothetical protein AAJ76_7700010362 [Vairimorpha ceranae]